MPVTPADLHDIAARASLLSERLSGRLIPDPTGDLAVGETRWQRWSRMVALDDESAFVTRLARDGWDDRDLRPWLTAVRFASPDDLPGWTQTLQALITAAENPSPAWAELPPIVLPHRAVPFQTVVAPFVGWAMVQLREQSGAAWSLLSPASQGALGHALLQQLSGLTEGCLARALTAARTAQSPSAVSQAAWQEGFGRALRAGGLVPFFRTFSVLGRLVARSVEQWLSANTRFLSRLSADRQVLTDLGSGDPGLVTALHPVLSDRHNGGQTVYRLRFASGLDLAYKPKSVAAEAAYADLIAWVNAHEPPLPLHTARAIDRDGYGWQLWIEAAPCTTPTEQSELLQRTGMLAVLLHALGGVDFGADNVVRAGGMPVPVDLETLLHPRRPATGEAPGPDADVADSLWRTGLLPDWPSAPSDDRLGDVSFVAGLAAAPDAGLAMQTGEVVSGMAAMQAWLSHHREAFGNQLRHLADVPMRYVARPTIAYTELLARLLRPEYLQDGADFSIGLELLAVGQSAARWDLLADEQAALAELDIPVFTHVPSRSDLHLPDGTRLPSLFADSALNQVLGRLEQRSSDMNAREQMITRTTIAACLAR
jgi:lantibiotic modifying enzyme